MSHAPNALHNLDLERPNAARMYDYFLGGDSNYAVDREAGRKILADVWPETAGLARQNRALLGRYTRNAIAAGIRQFIDLGSGIPTVGNVHEIVRETVGDDVDVRVVYSDYEAVAVAHSRILLEDQEATGWAGMVEADARDTESVLQDPITQELIDWNKPIALTCVALLHFMGDDDDPGAVLARYAAHLPVGSWLCFSHFTADDGGDEGRRQVEALADFYSRRSSNPAFPRSLDQIGPWFDLPGWSPVDPGIVHGVDWRPYTELDDLEQQLRPYFWAGAIERNS